MEEIYIDYSLIEDLHLKGHAFTVSYIFSYMQEEVRKGKKIVLERPISRGSKVMEFQHSDHIKEFYGTFIKQSPGNSK